MIDPVRTVQHPEVGTIRTHVVQLRPAQNPALILTVHRPADDDSKARLVQLLDGVDQRGAAGTRRPPRRPTRRST